MPAASTTEIANLAISHLGIGKEIGNLETEKSEEAQAIRRFFDTVRNQVLRDFPWPFATKFVNLALVEQDPTEEWAFSYRHPSDALKLRRILSGLRNDHRQSKVPFRISRDDSGLLIFTDFEDAQLEYTFEEEDPLRFPDDFIQALSFRLAAYVAPRLTKGDPFKVGRNAMEMYLFEINRAQSTAANEEQMDEIPQSEFIRFREGISENPSRRGDFIDLFGP